MTTKSLLDQAIRNVTTPRGREFFSHFMAGPECDFWKIRAVENAVWAVRHEYHRLRVIKRGKRTT